MKLEIRTSSWHRLFSFPYSTSIIEKLKKYPGVYWNKSEKSWSVPWDLERRVKKEVFNV